MLVLGSNILLFDNVHDNASQDGPLFPATPPSRHILDRRGPLLGRIGSRGCPQARSSGCEGARVRQGQPRCVLQPPHSHRHALPSTDCQIGHHIVKGSSVPLFSAALASAPLRLAKLTTSAQLSKRWALAFHVLKA